MMKEKSKNRIKPEGIADSNYALEKLGQAVYVLATGKGTIRGRIAGAYLAILPLQERDFPEELQNDFKWVKSELTIKPSKMITVIRDGHVSQESTGRLGATLSYLRISKLVAVAEKICYLESRLRHLLDCQRAKDE